MVVVLGGGVVVDGGGVVHDRVETEKKTFCYKETSYGKNIRKRAKYM